MTQPTAPGVREVPPETFDGLRRRRRWIPLLVLATLVPYYALLAAATFAPGLLADPLFVGGIPAGWAIALALLVEAWLLTGWYICAANRAAVAGG